MKEFHFKEYLTGTSLDDMAQKHNFKDSTGMEKYIMDFEILFHVLRVLPDCVVKGGMAVPFHVRGDLRRLSEDIDVVTGLTKEETMEAIGELREQVAPLVDIPQQPHEPKKLHKRLPLLTYWCKYRSTTPNSEIKLEIFYGDKKDIPTRTISDGFEPMGFKVDFPVPVYDHGPLIIDKIATLAFKTIGIPESRRQDVPKQIYDIASLLKSLNGAPQLGHMAGLLASISAKESGYCTQQYQLGDIMADLDAFSDSLIDSRLQLNRSEQGRLGTFRTQLLASSYTKTDYVVDILLIKFFVKLIRNTIKGIQDPTAAGRTMNKALITLKSISDSSPADKSWRQSIVNKYDSSERKYVRGFQSRQLYLYDCIREADLDPSPQPPS